ncbi:MAG: hypothetical protein ABGZ53_25100 [Fuerstiella sp.]
MTSNSVNGDRPFRFIIDEQNQLRCPLCADECVHFGPVDVEQGYTVTHCDGGSTQVVYRNSTPHKGSVIRLHMFCENNHSWQYVMSFHKGNAFLQLADCPADGGELWRS